MRDDVLVCLRAAETDPQIEGRELELSHLGDTALPILWELMVSGTWPGSSDAALDGVMTPARLELLFDGLESFDPSVLRGFVRDTVDPGSPSAERIAGLQVLGLAGESKDVSYMVDLACSGPDAEALVQPAEAWHAAMVKLIRREPRACDRLSLALLPDTVHLWPYAVDAAAEAPPEIAFPVLFRMLVFEPESALYVIPQLGVVGSRLSSDPGEAAVSEIRRYLEDGSPVVRRESILALGRLHDFESVPALISRLEDERESIRAAALWSLQHMSLLDFPPDERRWTTWLRAEHRWFEERYDSSLRENLFRAQVDELQRIVEEISMHRLYRDQLAADLAPLLQERDPSIQLLACDGLRILRSQRVRSALVQCLEEATTEVHAAACKALNEILDDPPEGCALD